MAIKRKRNRNEYFSQPTKKDCFFSQQPVKIPVCQSSPYQGKSSSPVITSRMSAFLNSKNPVLSQQEIRALQRINRFQQTSVPNISSGDHSPLDSNDVLPVGFMKHVNQWLNSTPTPAQKVVNVIDMQSSCTALHTSFKKTTDSHSNHHQCDGPVRSPTPPVEQTASMGHSAIPPISPINMNDVLDLHSLGLTHCSEIFPADTLPLVYKIISCVSQTDTKVQLVPLRLKCMIFFYIPDIITEELDVLQICHPSLNIVTRTGEYTLINYKIKDIILKILWYDLFVKQNKKTDLVIETPSSRNIRNYDSSITEDCSLLVIKCCLRYGEKIVGYLERNFTNRD